MISRILAAGLLSLGFALAGAGSAFAQGPDKSKPGPRTSHKGSHGHKHHCKKHRGRGQTATAASARRKVEALTRALSAAKRELASFERQPSPGGFGGPAVGGGVMRGGVGGFSGGSSAGGGPRGGSDSSTTGGGGPWGSGGFSGGFGGIMPSGFPGFLAAPNAGSSSEMVQIKKDIAELRDTVAKLAEVMKKDRR